MSSAILRNELLNDPLLVGYAGMTDAAVLTSLVDESLRPVSDLDIISSADLYEAVDRAEYVGLQEAQKDQVRVLLGLGGDINIGPNSKARANLLNIFGVGTETRAALTTIVTNRTTSRAKELGVKQSQLTEGGIAAARIMQP